MGNNNNSLYGYIHVGIITLHDLILYIFNEVQILFRKTCFKIDINFFK